MSPALDYNSVVSEIKSSNNLPTSLISIKCNYWDNSDLSCQEISIVQMSKLRHKEVKYFVQSHRAKKE